MLNMIHQGGDAYQLLAALSGNRTLSPMFTLPLLPLRGWREGGPLWDRGSLRPDWGLGPSFDCSLSNLPQRQGNSIVLPDERSPTSDKSTSLEQSQTLHYATPSFLDGDKTTPGSREDNRPVWCVPLNPLFSCLRPQFSVIPAPYG